MNKLIETERLIITEMTMDMAMDVHKNSLDEDTKRFVPDEVFETLEDAVETIDFLILQYETMDGPLVYALLTKDENKNIGYVQLVPIGDGKWEIGYHVAKPFTRRGYATEAVSAFLPLMADRVDISEVYGIRLLDNVASGRVLDKCGFQTFFTGKGEYHDGIYEISKSVWKREANMKVSNIFKTKRLILRRWEENDAEDLYKYASNPEVGPIAGWPAHQSIGESLDVIKNVFNAKEAYAICLKEDGKAIGAIELRLNGVTDLTDRDDECELGYWLGKPFWGQGIMPEAVNEMLRHAFEDIGMQKVWCGYYEGNNKSKRVQEKCGFKYQWKSEGVDVPLMHEKRTGHVSLMTKENWYLLQNNNRDYSIKKVTIDDYDDIYKLWSSTEQTKRAMNPVDDTREGIERYLKRNPNTCFAAVKDGRIIGVILTGHDGRRGIIHHLCVHPDNRQMGIAGHLVSLAEEALKKEGIQKIFGLVFKDNDVANAFWEKQGYSLRTNLNYRNKSLNDDIPTGE